MGRLFAGFLLALVVLSATTVSAEVIWRGDFETGDMKQWKGAPKTDAITVVKDPVREGQYALRIDGTNAAKKGKHDRIELQHQPKPPGTAEGTERYFGWSVYLPKKLTERNHSLGYFETRNSWSQLMAFEVKGEDILFTTRVPYTRQWNGKGKMTAGKWHDFAVHVLWSRDSKKGFVELWFDGEKVVPLTKTATLRDANVAFFQIGLFRETSDVPETILLDHVTEATTLKDVTPPPIRRRGARPTVPRPGVVLLKEQALPLVLCGLVAESVDPYADRREFPLSLASTETHLPEMDEYHEACDPSSRRSRFPVRSASVKRQTQHSLRR